MATTPCPTPTTRYEAELTAYVALCAEADAVRVGEFFRQFGIAPQPGQTLEVPAAHLLDFGAAMRMLAWEEAGLDIHRQVGLPAAREALAETLLVPTRAEKRRGDVDTNPTLLPTVLRLLVNHLAWSGQRCLGAEVALEAPDEDALVEAVAGFLWAHRDPAAPAPEGTVP